MLGLPNYLYRLIPANPILLRVVSVGGKRKRDLFVRCGYLALLIVIVVIAFLTGGSDVTGGADLDTLSRDSLSIFKLLSYLQLALVALMAPVFTAGAITQEKDSQTYDILLTTPLSNGQIVLGTLLSRLFFVFALLLSGVPIFSITQIFGGVAIGDIVTSFLIAAVTALVTGALAVGIATFKIGTRRTIFSFFMFVAIYLVGGLLLDQLDWLHPTVLEADGTFARSQTSWLTGLHPFLALMSVLEPDTYQPPTLAQLPAALQFWPVSWYLTQPVSFYLVSMTVASAAIVLPGIALLRRVAQSTLTFRGWMLKKLRLDGLKRAREPRHVWNNPIAWREAKTKASAAKATVTRYGFILVGLAGAITLAVLHATETGGGPANYVDLSSYDRGAQSVAIYGEANERYGIVPGAQITLNHQRVSLDDLRGRYAAENVQTVTRQDGTKALTALTLSEIPRVLSRRQVQQFLLGAVFLETVVILLIVTNAAASTVTREKEDGTLDLLLSTPITSKYYLWGKLRGLVSYVLPLVAVPAASVLVFVLYDLARTVTGDTNQWTVYPEAMLLLPAMLVLLASFASIVGMQMSLRLRTTVRAVMASIAIVLGVVGVLGFCGYTLIDSDASSNPVPYAIAAFSPFTTMAVLISPQEFGGELFFTGDASEVAVARFVIILFTLIAIAAYAAAVWGMYRSMVKNFDMTIRRQHR